jgi:hypothetical protein
LHVDRCGVSRRIFVEDSHRGSPPRVKVEVNDRVNLNVAVNLNVRVNVEVEDPAAMARFPLFYSS